MVRAVEAIEDAWKALAMYPKLLIRVSGLYVLALGAFSIVPVGALVALPFLTGGLYGVIYNKVLGGKSTPREAFKRTGKAYYSSLVIVYIVRAAAVVVLVGPVSVLLSVTGNMGNILSAAIIIVFGAAITIFWAATQFAPVIVVREEEGAVAAYRQSASSVWRNLADVALYTLIRFSIPIAGLGLVTVLANESLAATVLGVVIAGTLVLFAPVFSGLYHTAYYEYLREE